MVSNLKRDRPATNLNCILRKVQAEIERTTRRNTSVKSSYKN